MRKKTLILMMAAILGCSGVSAGVPSLASAYAVEDSIAEGPSLVTHSVNEDEDCDDDCFPDVLNVYSYHQRFGWDYQEKAISPVGDFKKQNPFRNREKVDKYFGKYVEYYKDDRFMGYSYNTKVSNKVITQDRSVDYVYKKAFVRKGSTLKYNLGTKYKKAVIMSLDCPMREMPSYSLENGILTVSNFEDKNFSMIINFKGNVAPIRLNVKVVPKETKITTVTVKKGKYKVARYAAKSESLKYFATNENSVFCWDVNGTQLAIGGLKKGTAYLELCTPNTDTSEYSCSDGPTPRKGAAKSRHHDADKLLKIVVK